MALGTLILIVIRLIIGSFLIVQSFALKKEPLKTLAFIFGLISVMKVVDTLITFR